MPGRADRDAGRGGGPAAGLDWRRELERLRGAYADNSLRNTATSFRVFERWCEQEGRCPLPASPDTVAGAVLYFFSRSRTGTVKGRLYAIRAVHRTLRLPDPTVDEAVRLAFRRGERLRAAQGRPCGPRQGAPINAALRARLAAACPDTLVGLRDRAMLSLGYDTLCRPGELVRLRVEDMSLLPSGGARVFLPRSKTDQVWRGAYVYISDEGLDEVQRWLLAADAQTGLILRPLADECVAGGAFEPGFVRIRLRMLAEAAGLTAAEAAAIRGHSMRIGAAQDLVLQGRTLAQIMRAGRWRSFGSVAHYIRAAPVNIWAAPDEDRADPAWPPGRNAAVVAAEAR